MLDLLQCLSADVDAQVQVFSKILNDLSNKIVFLSMPIVFPFMTELSVQYKRHDKWQATLTTV